MNLLRHLRGEGYDDIIVFVLFIEISIFNRTIRIVDLIHVSNYTRRRGH